MGSVNTLATVITLLTICLLVTNTSAGYYSCCRNYMKNRIPFKIIRGYSVQTATGMCPIDAIIFHTKFGKACVNPALPWVMAYVNKVSNRAQGVFQKSSQTKKQS